MKRIVAGVAVVSLSLGAVGGWLAGRGNAADTVSAHENAAAISAAGHVTTVIGALRKIQDGAIQEAVTSLEQSVQAAVIFLETSRPDLNSNAQSKIDFVLERVQKYEAQKKGK